MMFWCLTISASPSRLPPRLTIPSHTFAPHDPASSATIASFSHTSNALKGPASSTCGHLRALVGVEVAAGTFFTRLHFPLTWQHCMQALVVPPPGVHSSPLSRHQVHAVASSGSTAAGH